MSSSEKWLTTIQNDLQKEDNMMALQHCNEALSENCDNGKFYYYRAVCYFCQGQYFQAIIDFRAGIGLGVENYIIYNNLGLAYAKNNNKEEAFECYEKAIKINPSRGEAYINLGNLLSHDDPRLFHYYEKAYENNIRDKNLLIILIQLYGNEGRLEKVKKLGDEAILEFPNNSEIHFYYGKSLMFCQQLEGAKVHLEQFIKSDNSEPALKQDANFLLLQINMKLHQLMRASSDITLFGRQEHIRQENVSDETSWLEKLEKLLEQRENINKRIEKHFKALQKIHSAINYYKTSELFLELFLTIKGVERHLKNSKKNFMQSKFFAQIFSQIKDCEIFLEDALQAAEMAISMGENTFKLRGKIYFYQGNYQAAILDFQKAIGLNKGASIIDTEAHIFLKDSLIAIQNAKGKEMSKKYPNSFLYKMSFEL